MAAAAAVVVVVVGEGCTIKVRAALPPWRLGVIDSIDAGDLAFEPGQLRQRAAGLQVNSALAVGS